MIEKVLKARLAEYSPRNSIEQENVLQEIAQHFILASLSKTAFFSRAFFHGGTCLRILFDLPRFSEDLDFMLREPDPAFKWPPFIQQIQDDFLAQGLTIDAKDPSTAEGAVRKAILKADSLGAILSLDLPFSRHRNRTIRVKLEIDANPPQGSTIETGYITFPKVAPLSIQTLPSGFATKMHALLCRRYIKGRDWFDFLWYIQRKVKPDLLLLANALHQYGPWAGQNLSVDHEWIADALRSRIESLDWKQTADDVRRFLPLAEQESLEHWSVDFFLFNLNRMF